MIEAVVFDFDGTLSELRLDFQELKNEVLKVLSRYVTAEALDRKKWHFIIEMIHELARECEPDNSRALVRDGFRRLAELECDAARGKDVFPFTRHILSWLKDQDVKIGIITRSCRDAVMLAFDDLPDYVAAMVTRDDIATVKPDPGHIQAVLAQLQVTPEKALMVGDHPTDILAGKAFSVKTLGVLSGRTTKEAMEQAGADYIAADIRSLPGIIAQFGQPPGKQEAETIDNTS